MNVLARCGVLLCAAGLAACASTGLRDAPTATVPDFELQGRVLVKSQERGFSSAVRWQQRAGADELWLTAPLGQTIAHVQADAQGATLTAADQRRYQASSIESLMRSALGWRFPVSGLRYWVRGEAAPHPGGQEVERDASQRITRMREDDWQVTFVYGGNESRRPSRVDAASGDVEIRLVVDAYTELP